MVEKITIKEAVAKGITKVRLQKWGNPYCHIKIDIIDGALGPWMHLYDPFNLECNGRDPVSLPSPLMDSDKREYVPYDGPSHESDVYKAEQKRSSGCLKISTLVKMAEE